MDRSFGYATQCPGIITIQTPENLMGETYRMQTVHQCRPHACDVKPYPVSQREPLAVQNPLQALLVVDGRFKSMLKSSNLKPTIRGNHSKINHAGRFGHKQRLAWIAKIDSRLAIDRAGVQSNPALGLRYP